MRNDVLFVPLSFNLFGRVIRLDLNCLGHVMDKLGCIHLIYVLCKSLRDRAEMHVLSLVNVVYD